MFTSEILSLAVVKKPEKLTHSLPVRQQFEHWSKVNFHSSNSAWQIIQFLINESLGLS